MKKKILIYIMIFAAAACFSNFLTAKDAKAGEISTDTQVTDDTGVSTETDTGTETGTDTGTAEETQPVIIPVSSLTILQYPSKTVYSQGEPLDLSDMIVQVTFIDGTTIEVTDYTVTGYDSNLIGAQTVTISYQGQAAVFIVSVIPAKVTNVSLISSSTSSLTLTWDSISNALRYEIYSLDSTSGNYVLAAVSDNNSVTLNYPAGTIQNYQICVVEQVSGVECRGGFSDTFTAATNPEAVSDLNISNTTTSAVHLYWNAVNGATGYVIYRSLASDDYEICGTSDSAQYIDTGLSSGQSYRYKVCAYTLDQSYSGDFSDSVDTSTCPAKVPVKYKMGEEKVRITYTKVTGASYYDIYIGDDEDGYSLLTSRKASYQNYYVAEGLTTGNTYYFYVVARKNYNDTEYVGPESDEEEIVLEEVAPTSTYAKYFESETEFLNSWSYRKLTFFKKNVVYTKSYIIPGLATTNVGGFTSTTMCPQGITFAEGYLLMTAYDLTDEENSVIYVMDKKTKELITTLILPSKTHAGGISYDGTNLWIPTGTKVSSIPYSEVRAAVESGEAYYNVSYTSTCSLGITASYLTYYDSKLWVGSYDELNETNMYSYTIENKDTVPTLTQKDKIVMPTRVQGAVFTSRGTLILSRSCQLYTGLRGYMRQIDLYKPDFANEVNGVISIGTFVNSVEMPSMNEEIAIDGNYLYVNFESGAFKDASYKMDRICAFKLTSLTKKQ